VPLVKKIDKEIEKLASKTKSLQGVGGMATKIIAAKNTTKYGVPVIVANGRIHGILKSIFQGEEVGTLFLPQKRKLASRKHWIACALKPKGMLIIDDGAQEAILKKGKSLLPVGITKVEGNFQFGDSVVIQNQKREEIARGLVNYSNSELEKIIGLSSKEIDRILGYRHYEEVIHRDDLVIL